MKKAKTLTQQLAIAASLADEVAGDVAEITRKAAEFTGVAVKAPHKVTQQLVPPTVSNDTVQSALNDLIAIANRAAASGASLRQAIDLAAAAAANPSAPKASQSPAQKDSDDKATAAAALARLGRARSLNPNWWCVSAALGELVLSHYERQTPQGDLQPLPDVPLGFREALGEFRSRAAVASNELPPPSSTAAAGQVPAEADLLNIAEEYFDLAISQNPDSIDAYRDRAEVLRLKSALDNAANHPQQARHHLTAAQESAAHACTMGNYRQPGSLRTLAQVDHDLKLYGPAADLAERSLAFLPPEDQPLYQPFWDKYVQLAQQSGIDEGAAVADNNAGPGGVAMRGEGGGAAPDLGNELSSLVSEFSDSGGSPSGNAGGFMIVTAKTRGEGDNSTAQPRLIRRPPPRLPRSFISRAP